MKDLMEILNNIIHLFYALCGILLIGVSWAFGPLADMFGIEPRWAQATYYLIAGAVGYWITKFK